MTELSSKSGDIVTIKCTNERWKPYPKEKVYFVHYEKFKIVWQGIDSYAVSPLKTIKIGMNLSLYSYKRYLVSMRNSSFTGRYCTRSYNNPCDGIQYKTYPYDVLPCECTHVVLEMMDPRWQSEVVKIVGCLEVSAPLRRLILEYVLC